MYIIDISYKTKSVMIRKTIVFWVVSSQNFLIPRVIPGVISRGITGGILIEISEEIPVKSNSWRYSRRNC